MVSVKWEASTVDNLAVSAIVPLTMPSANLNSGKPHAAL